MTVTEETIMREDASPDKSEGLLNGRFRVDLSARLNTFDTGMNQAFKVTDIRNSDADLFAIVANPYNVHRKSLLAVMESRAIPGMIDLRARGPVTFGSADIRDTFVFDRPKGARVVPDAENPLSEKQVLEKILPSITETLLILHPGEIPHRGIRADNLFYTDESRRGVLLGEGVTAPGGSVQPTVYEPLESASAHVFGRGDGLPGHDIYALGVLIVHLLGGVLPRADLSDEDLYVQKLEHGSYTLLTEGLALSSRVAELLRGALQDNPYRRWDVTMLAHWREVVNDPPKQGPGDRIATGSIIFDEKEFLSPRLLAHAMKKKPGNAYQLLESDKLSTWTRNALHDAETADEISDIALSQTGAAPGHRRNEMTAVARACSLLDPRGVFWFRDVSFARSGLGNLLVNAIQMDMASIKSAIAELLESGLLLSVVINDSVGPIKKRRGWISYADASHCFEHMKSKSDPGFGLERCLYELNPDVACLSSITLGSNVRNMRQFIDIIEKKLLSSGGSDNPFDRHSAAFIAAKSRGVGKILIQIGSAEPESVTEAVARLALFSALQNMYHPAPLPGLCLWAEAVLRPVFGKIRSRLRREIIEQRFEIAKKSGSLEKILSATDIQRQLKADEKEYSQALTMAAMTEKTAVHLEHAVEERKMAAARYGSWITAVLAIASLATSMMVSSLYFIG